MRLYLKRILSCLSLFAALTISLHAYAESSKQFGDYTIHYTAFRSDTLQPEIAKAYNLTRRNNRVIINIAVIKNVAGTTGTASSAKVEGQASNLTGQLKQLDFREIKEGSAIYYLAETQVSNGEFLKFDLKITPAGGTETARVNFDKRFFTN
jgi:hypothetical protein